MILKRKYRRSVGCLIRLKAPRVSLHRQDLAPIGPMKINGKALIALVAGVFHHGRQSCLCPASFSFSEVSFHISPING
jgi:hypothetical protein